MIRSFAADRNDETGEMGRPKTAELPQTRHACGRGNDVEWKLLDGPKTPAIIGRSVQ